MHLWVLARVLAHTPRVLTITLCIFYVHQPASSAHFSGLPDKYIHVLVAAVPCA
jgi:hypothetical protein